MLQVLARCVRGGIYAARGLRQPLAKAEFEAAAQARLPQSNIHIESRFSKVFILSFEKF